MDAGANRRTIVFFPEGAHGPTNNCVGIGDVLRRRGHRVVFIVEESFAGTLEARGFEERRMRLGPPSAEPEVPGQFWIDFIRDTAPVFRKSTIEQLGEFIDPVTVLVAPVVEVSLRGFEPENGAVGQQAAQRLAEPFPVVETQTREQAVRRRSRRRIWRRRRWGHFFTKVNRSMR